MFSFGFCLETALDDEMMNDESWMGGPGSLSGVSAPVAVFFWTCMKVIVVGKANSAGCYSSRVCNSNFTIILGMFVIEFQV